MLVLRLFRSSLEINHKVLDVVKKSQTGAGVAVKIESASYENDKSYGRQCEFFFFLFCSCDSRLFSRKCVPLSRRYG